ncbi:MAG TPA: HAMP domain-containing sensor histidine kinase [Actinomycetota bacterium]|nr:HAMP domain-containing sensor histidine kinase [Actinomycetota bacterium]
MLRFNSLRFRIAAAYIVGAIVVAGAVAAGTYSFTSWALTRQVVQNAKVQTFDQLAFLRDQLKLNPGPGKIRTYLQTLQQRGSELVVKTQGIRNAESTSLDVTEDAVPAALRRAVESGEVGYAIARGPGHRRLFFGSPVPGRTIYTYFVFSLENIDRTLSLLWRVLLAVLAVAGGAAGAVGLRLADRTIRPLRVAADAAQKVAQGGLETRLEATGEDELARLARDFNSMTEALEKRIVRERQFISDVSHELRTPLTALKASIDFIGERGADLPGSVRSAIGLAAEEVASLRRLVDDLLELSRADAGAMQVASDEVDLRDFANQIARTRAPNTLVEIDGPDHLIVHTDKMRLERVVGNLLENAVMHASGEDVRIELEALNGAARIVVADRGPGIDHEQLPRIFDRFWRGDASRTRESGVGAGLGLAIAHENAKLLGADLQVESTIGEGTRFEVLLPTGAEQ